MQSSIKTPKRDQLGVITWFSGKVPERNVTCWSNFHYRVQSAEGEPATTNFRFHQLFVVATDVGAPVWITHYGRALDGDDRRAQPSLGTANVSAPEYGVR